MPSTIEQQSTLMLKEQQTTKTNFSLGKRLKIITTGQGQDTPVNDGINTAITIREENISRMAPKVDQEC